MNVWLAVASCVVNKDFTVVIVLYRIVFYLGICKVPDIFGILFLY